MKYTTIQQLPDDLFQEVFKRHTHAEIENDFNPHGVVYTEKSLLEIINILLNKYEKMSEVTTNLLAQDVSYDYRVLQGQVFQFHQKLSGLLQQEYDKHFGITSEREGKV